MIKTTVYLPEELKESLARLAAQEDCSEAHLIREAILVIVERYQAPRPVLPLNGATLGDPMAGEKIGDFMTGFGSS